MNHHTNYKTIKYLLDVDGFTVSGKFLPKEMAVMDLDTGIVENQRYRVGNFYKLNDRDRKQALYVKNNIHGLKFSDERADLPQYRVLERVRELCAQAEIVDRKVGYKGGHYESDILREIGYAHVGFNIEYLDCPKFETIITHNPQWYDDAKIYGCGRHFIRDTRKTPHCPTIELLCFAKWLKVNNKI